MNKNTNRFSFIHPTKCGGTAVENFLLKHYSKYFILKSHHTLTCNNYNNPIGNNLINRTYFLLLSFASNLD